MNKIQENNYLSSIEAADIIRKHGIVGLPTETVYGLAGLASSEVAVDRIYEAKRRPKDNPLICHCDSLEQILEYAINVPPYLDALVKEFSPGPVSYLLDIPKDSPLLPATRGTNACIFRIPDSLQFQEVIKIVGKPICAPSANTSGRPSPTNAEMVVLDLGDRIDGVVDGGSAGIGLESSILDCRNSELIKILRPGVVGALEILEFINKNQLRIKIECSPKKTETTPGSKYRHYSPKTPIYRFLVSSGKLEGENSKKLAVLGCSEDLAKLENQGLHQDIIKINLGSKDNLEEIAHNLYQNLVNLDKLTIDKAYWLDFNMGTNSLAMAIEDKLVRILE